MPPSPRPPVPPSPLSPLALLLLCWAINPESAAGLPPPEDIPEEILRGQIITEARSPIDGQPMTVAEYARLIQTHPELEYPDFPPPPEPEVSSPAPSSPSPTIIDWQSLRDLFRQVFPF
ncbi:MAG: hypothetical protein F6J93_10540 [Oscillatoria sp. SIO1A7]|nr:hypothetical protein [Oscillatoria sp. SIO1A7]